MSSAIESLVNREYAYGFVTDVETDTVPPGLNEDVVRAHPLRAGVHQPVLFSAPPVSSNTSVL